MHGMPDERDQAPVDQARAPKCRLYHCNLEGLHLVHTLRVKLNVWGSHLRVLL